MIAGLGWAWAAGLLALRQHWVVTCVVVPTAPPAWGVVVLPLGRAIFLAVAAAALAWGANQAGKRLNRGVASGPMAWLLAAWIIPILSLLRLAGLEIERTFLDPLLLAGITGAAVGGIAASYSFRDDHTSARLTRATLATVVLMATAACGWWMFEGVTAFHNYHLGYCDFAQYGWRVANTWAGRGFMMETPSLAWSWDHFCPAVALLAPVWGLTHDARMYIVLQALCLSLPAVFIYLIVRRSGGGGVTAAVWSAAYLVFPAVSQLNLNYSYGWHPVSVALVLFFAAMLALVARRKLMAALLAAFACTWQDYVSVNLAWFALTMAAVGWLARRGRGEVMAGPGAGFSLASSLRPWTWFVTAGMAAIYFLVIFNLAAFAEEETGRFANLGDSPVDVVLSPFLRPKAFWGTIFRERSIVFVLALTVPLGLANLGRGWRTLLATVLPLGTLVAWEFPPATSIAFQYHTLLLPVLFGAAISGAALGGLRARLRDGSPAGSSISLPARGLWLGGVVALAASFTASLTLGALPWSGATRTGLAVAGYPGNNRGETVADTRRVGSAANAALNRIVAQVGQKDAYVLASGRVAAHLLKVERLEPVGTARERWHEFAAQAVQSGRGRSAVELFDWVVLDFREQFYQSEADMLFIAQEAGRAGFELVHNKHQILVCRAPRKQRPGSQ